MVKDLDYLLSRHSLFNIAVYGADGRLLGPVILPASAAYDLNGLKHHRNHNNRDQGQPHISINHKGKGSHNIDGAGDQLDHRVVEHFPHRIHVIGKTAHHIPVIVGIVIAHGKLLHLSEKIVSKLANGILGNPDHDSLLQILCGHPCQVNDCHSQNPFQEKGCASLRRGQTVDNGTQHIGACQISKGAADYAKDNNEEL